MTPCWRPLPLVRLLRRHGVRDRGVLALLLGWLALTAATVAATLLAGAHTGLLSVIPVRLGPLRVYLSVYPPLIIGTWLMLWLGLFWAAVPAYLAGLALGLMSGVPVGWAMLLALANPLGLLFYGLAYRSVHVRYDLRTVGSAALFLVVGFISVLASGMGAFLYSHVRGLSLRATLATWEGWWLGGFVQTLLIGAPVLMLASGAVERLKARYFGTIQCPSPSPRAFAVSGVAAGGLAVLFAWATMRLASLRLFEALSEVPEPAHDTVLAAHASAGFTAAALSVVLLSLVIGGVVVARNGNRLLRGEVQTSRRALRAMEGRFRAFFDLTCRGALCADEEGRIVEANPAGEQMLAAGRGGLIGRHLEDLPWEVADEPAPDCPRAENPALRALREGREVRDVLMAMPADEAATRWLSLNAVPHAPPSGGVREIFVVFEDVTRRRAAEQELRRYGERLRHLREVDRAILSATSGRDGASMARGVLDQLASLVPCVRASIVTFDLERRIGKVVALRGPAGSALAEGREVSLAPFGDLDQFARGRVHLAEDLREATELPEAQALLEDGVCAYVSVPLVAQGELLGALNVGKAEPGPFPEADVRIVREVADSCAVAMRTAQMLESVREQREELRALAARLAGLEEMERLRLAQELHDQTGPSLAALGINLNLALTALRSIGGDEGVSRRIENAIELSEQVGRQVRRVMADLHPPVLDDYGLCAALQWYARRFSRQTGLDARVYGREIEPRLRPEVETALFRIAQEAMTNAAKHARASRVDLTLEQEDGRVRLTVVDDGVGFVPARKRRSGQGGWGMVTMRERAAGVAGRLEVHSAPGQGTQVIVEVGRHENAGGDTDS